MANIPHSRLVMLGPQPGTRSGIAAAVEAYRAAGLFRRWPAEYLATHTGGGAGRTAAVALSALRHFIALAARERGLVVHVHAAGDRGFWREALFAALALVARCALILHLHGDGFERLRDGAGPLGRRLMRFLLERASCIVVPCESLRAWVAGIAPGARTACVPDPVSSVEASQDATRPNLVLFLSRLDPANGLFDLLEAVSGLRAAIPDVRLVCAGEGDRVAFERHAEQLGIRDAVSFTGWVGPSSKRALLESAAVLALPSYQQALPASLVEAMAAGLPVVASPVGDVPEVVAEGVTGFLAAPGDVATLQRALRKLLLDRALGARIGAAARESVRLRFAPERVVPRLEGVYAAVGLCALAVTPATLRDAGMKGAA